jgi:hypothetical protein
VTGRPGVARSANARSARRLLHSALTRQTEDGGREGPSWVLCNSLLRRELAHAQRPKFSRGRASRAALRASSSRTVAACPHRFCRLWGVGRGGIGT